MRKKLIDGNDVTYLASMAKLKSGRLLREVSDICLQFWGGMGITWEYDLGHFAKRLIMINHEFVDEDHHLNCYAKFSS